MVTREPKANLKADQNTDLKTGPRNRGPATYTLPWAHGDAQSSGRLQVPWRNGSRWRGDASAWCHCLSDSTDTALCRNWTPTTARGLRLWISNFSMMSIRHTYRCRDSMPNVNRNALTLATISAIVNTNCDAFRESWIISLRSLTRLDLLTRTSTLRDRTLVQAH